MGGKNGRRSKDSGLPRLAIVTPVMAPYRTPVFNALADRGDVELLVIYQSAISPIHGWEPRPDAARFDFEVLSSIAEFGNGIRRTWLSRGLIRRLAGFRPHAVVAGGYNQPVAYEILAARRPLGYEAWIWLESTAGDARSEGWVREIVKRTVVRSADGILVPGCAARDYASALGADPRRVRVAPNAVDVDALSSAAARAAPDREAIRKRLGLLGTVFVYVGRMVREKGVYDLLTAFRETTDTLRSSGEECSLLVVGDGQVMDHFRKRARSEGLERVVTVGFVQQEELPEMLVAADVMVLPTWSDPWGFVLNEAQACGLPAIATDVAGASPDLLEGTGAGLVVAPRAPCDLARAMIELARDEPRRRAMREAARNTARRFTPELCADGFAGIVQEAARSSRRGRGAAFR